MKDKKKLIILSSIILGVLVLTLGLTYAAFTYNKTGETSELVLGDIWMKYTENNQLVLSDAMPMNINKYTNYKVNPVMQTQEINELSYCVWFMENLVKNTVSIPRKIIPESGTTMADFCRGTAREVIFQSTMNQSINELGLLYPDEIQLLEDNGVILQNDDSTYSVNPIMETQTVLESEELFSCIDTFTNYQVEYGELEFDEGSDINSFCQGTGTIWGGMTIQDSIDSTEYFLEKVGQELLENEVILQQISSNKTYKVNEEMTEEEVQLCVNYFEDVEFDEGSTAESFCKGTGTLWGITFQEAIDSGDFFSHSFLTYFEENNIIVVESEDKLPYFEFTISGKNTYEKEDIWYDIVLTYGGNHETRTTRIRDDLLRFSLTKVEDESEILLFNNISYEELYNKRIWVETINANTTSEVNNKYRLYMWISEDTVIGNVNQDYTLEEWNDVFASIKVGVTGDFVEKVIYTDERCFEYSEISWNNGDIGISITGYDETCGSDVVIPKTINGYNVMVINSEAFGSKRNGGKNLTSVVIPDSVIEIGDYAFYNNQLTRVEIPNNVTTIGEYAFSGNWLEHIVLGNNIIDIGEGAFAIPIAYFMMNPINTIVNKSGNIFNWNDILDISKYTEEEHTFATGTIKYNLGSERQVNIIGE